MKKIAILILMILFLVPVNAFAYKKVNVTASVKEIEFESENVQYVYIKTEGDAELKNVAYLPKGATLKAQVLCIEKERRWHKAAYALLKLVSFVPENSDETIDLSEDNLYIAARKYAAIDASKIAGTGIELGASTAASFFIPGIDIAYYFTKGAIKREKYHNWFKAGVSEAYDNSIFWFFEKGRKIEIKEDIDVQLKSISDKKVNKLIKKLNN